MSPSDADDSSAYSHQFLSHLRHELRTPINHIVGYSELLLEGDEELPEDMEADLRRIRTAGRELLVKVNDSLTSTTLARTEAQLRTVSRDLRTLLTTVVGYSGLLLESCAERGLLAMEADLARIQAAGTQMMALVDSLLIPPERRNDSDVPRAPVDAGVPHQVGPPVTDHGRLLVVDDDEGNRNLLVRRLQRLGYGVDSVDGGGAALALLEAGSHELLLLDVTMPGMSGLEVLEQLRAHDRLRYLPVIVLSGVDDLDQIAACIQMGADDFLPKPLDPVILRARIGASLEKKRLRDREQLYLQQLDSERQRADELLHAIFPDAIVAELKSTDRVPPRRRENVAILFCDLVGFTTYCDAREPEEVVAHLQQLVEAFETIAVGHGVLKIKTIGDSFMAAAGLIDDVATPVLDSVRCGLEMLAAAEAAGWKGRIGIDVGPVVAGVLGRRQYAFDLWGDTVNTASHTESNGIPGRITLSARAWQQVAHRCVATSLGKMDLKGKGSQELFVVEEITDPADPAERSV
jgi:class 3 adenylate cyclase